MLERYRKLTVVIVKKKWAGRKGMGRLKLKLIAFK